MFASLDKRLDDARHADMNGYQQLRVKPAWKQTITSRSIFCDKRQTAELVRDLLVLSTEVDFVWKSGQCQLYSKLCRPNIFGSWTHTPDFHIHSLEVDKRESRFAVRISHDRQVHCRTKSQNIINLVPSQDVLQPPLFSPRLETSLLASQTLPTPLEINFMQRDHTTDPWHICDPWNRSTLHTPINRSRNGKSINQLID